MKSFLNKLHAKLGDLWWYSLMIFVACRSGDVIQAFIGLWLVPKYVGTEELGAVLPLQQLSGLFAVPLAIIATVFAKYVNTYATRGEYGKVKCFIRDVLLAACAVFLVCIIAAYLIIPHFYIRLNIASGMLTVLVLAAGFATNIASIFTAALQGLKKFKTMTVQNLISAPIRLITLLVAMPFRALSGYILGQATPPATCSVLAAYSLHKDLKSIPLDSSWRKDLPEIWRYLWPVAMYTSLNTLFITIGLTVYRQRLVECESAAYYLLSRLAEIAGYVGMSMAVVLTPLASEAHEKGRENSDFLFQTVLSSIGIAAALAAVFFFSAGPILTLNETWSAFAPYSSLLPILTLIAGIGTAKCAVISYEMACRRFWAAAVLLASSFIWTSLLVCLTGYTYFYGVLPSALVDKMEALRFARLSVIVYSSLAVEVLQLATVLAIHRNSRHDKANSATNGTVSQ